VNRRLIFATVALLPSICKKNGGASRLCIFDYHIMAQALDGLVIAGILRLRVEWWKGDP